MKIQTFIINLERARDRKEHMLQLLKSYNFLDVSFLAAVDGKTLTNDEINSCFDTKKTYKRYGRDLNRGEIGCTLSHINCYRQVLKNTANVSLILEDDISILKDISVLPDLIPLVDVSEPVILLLSGDYWYSRKLHNVKDLEVVKVFDAVGAYAYLINKAAAELIINKYSIPSHVADHWLLYREIGIPMLALSPYMIDANIGGLESTIKQEFFGENRKEMTIPNVIKAYWYAFVKKILLRLNHFVSKIRL